MDGQESRLAWMGYGGGALSGASAAPEAVSISNTDRPDAEELEGPPVGQTLAFFSYALDAEFTHRIGNVAVLAPGAAPILRLEVSEMNADGEPVAKQPPGR